MLSILAGRLEEAGYASLGEMVRAFTVRRMPEFILMEDAYVMCRHGPGGVYYGNREPGGVPRVPALLRREA